MIATGSSMLSAGEPPQRKWENADTRNGTINSGHIVATECHERNCRDGFHGNQMRYRSGSFLDMLSNMHDIHSETALYGAGHFPRDPVRMTCGCRGQQPELFYDHDHHQSAGHKSCCHGIGSSSAVNSNQTGHLHSVGDRGCCGSITMRRERSGLANCGVERARTTSRSSLFVDALEFQRNAAAVGSMPCFPSTPREVETRSLSVFSGSMANSTFRTQPKAANKQIHLYGWFLMNPPGEQQSSDSSACSSVAIGGYRHQKMEEKDFIGTAAVAERLERWKLRMMDGLEVGLMGMINKEKSVANGFCPPLVQCFSIGFPPQWIYILLSLQGSVSKASAPGMMWPSPSSTNAAGLAGVIRNPFKDCRGISMTLPPEANQVQSILQSSLFTAAPDIETTMANPARCSTATRTPLSRGGVSSDANSGPQLHLDHEQVDAPKEDDYSCVEADFTSEVLSPQTEEPASCTDGPPSMPGSSLPQDPGEVSDTSRQIQIPTNLKGGPSDTHVIKGEDDKTNSPGPPSISKDKITDEVYVEVSTGGAATCDTEKVTVAMVSIAMDDVPCAQMQTRKRLLSDIDTPPTDSSSVEPAVVTESASQDAELSKLSSERPIPVVNTPITASVADLVSSVQTRGRMKRQKSDSDTPLVEISFVESLSVAAADPVGTANPKDRRKRMWRESHPPVADSPVVEPITVSVADPVSSVQIRDSRKRLRSESLSRVPDIPLVPVTGSFPGPLGTVGTKDKRRKSPRSESLEPVIDVPFVKPIAVPVADPVGSVKTRDRRKGSRRESRSPVLQIPVVPVTGSVPELVGTVGAKDRRKSPRSESHEPVINGPLVEPITVPVSDLVGSVKTRDRKKGSRRESHSIHLVSVAGAVPDPVEAVENKDGMKSPRTRSHEPVIDVPSVEPVLSPVCSFRRSDSQVSASRDLTEETADGEVDDEFVRGASTQKYGLDVEVNQTCKDTVEVGGRSRRKRYKTVRKYYQRAKRKSCSKQALEKGLSRSDKSIATQEVLIEKSKFEPDESQVVEQTTEAVNTKVRRPNTSTRRNTVKLCLSLDAPESSAKKSNFQRGRQIKKSIVPPPLPRPRVADKSKVTEAFGLKRSLYGRILVPPLATWRNQSIKYDMDGGIIAISDGFTSSDEEKCTGFYNFKPPADKGARTMQRRLCKAADKVSRKK